MDIPSIEEILTLVSQVPGPLLLLFIALIVGFIMLLLVALVGLLRGRGVQKNVQQEQTTTIPSTNAFTSNSAYTTPMYSPPLVSTQPYATTQMPQAVLPSALEELTEQEAANFLASPPLGAMHAALAIKLYRVVREKNSQPFIPDTAERFLVLLSPPIDANISLKINGQLIQEQRGSGIWEYTFSSVGTVQLSAEVSGSTVIWSTVFQITEGTKKVGFDLSQVKLSVTKSDGVSSTVVYQSDYYLVRVEPNYPIKVNLMVDDLFFQAVEGSQYVQVHFTDEGEHTLYAMADQDQKIVSPLCRVDVRSANEAVPEEVGEQEVEEQQQDETET